MQESDSTWTRAPLTRAPWALVALPGHSTEQRPLRSGTSLWWTEPPEMPPPPTQSPVPLGRAATAVRGGAGGSATPPARLWQKRSGGTRQALKGGPDSPAVPGRGGLPEGHTGRVDGTAVLIRPGWVSGDEQHRQPGAELLAFERQSGPQGEQTSAPRVPPNCSPAGTTECAPVPGQQLGVCSTVRETGTWSLSERRGYLISE